MILFYATLSWMHSNTLMKLWNKSYDTIKHKK